MERAFRRLPDEVDFELARGMHSPTFFLQLLRITSRSQHASICHLSSVMRFASAIGYSRTAVLLQLLNS